MLSWIAGWPTRPRLVVASRTRPPLRALPRLLVEGEGLVLDRAALAFRPYEARALLAGSFGLLVSEEQARELAEGTEGWAAALSLVAQAAQSGGLPALVGTPREIFDYLAAAVVDELPDELEAFAMLTSVLFVLTPDICAALTGADARACLDALEARSSSSPGSTRTGPATGITSSSASSSSNASPGASPRWWPSCTGGPARISSARGGATREPAGAGCG